jgi:hypothetical protein
MNPPIQRVGYNAVAVVTTLFKENYLAIPAATPIRPARLIFCLVNVTYLFFFLKGFTPHGNNYPP